MTLATSYPLRVDVNHQATPTPGSATANSTAIYKDAIWGEKPRPEFGVETIYDLFQHSAAHAGDKNFLGHRPYNPNKQRFERYYEYQSYNEIAQRRTNLGSGISQLVKQGDLGDSCFSGWTAGTWSKNCPEWQIADLSLHAFSRISVPLYDTLGNDSVEYVINHSENRLIFTSSSHLPQLYKILHNCPSVEAVIVLDGLDEPGAPQDGARVPGQLSRADVLKLWAKNLNVRLYSLAQVEELGAIHQHPHIPPKPTDVLTISYTSGTTGWPKGAVHTHSSMCNNILSLTTGMDEYVGHLLASYMPLAHVLQRALEFIAMVLLAPIAYTTGDILRLMEDLQIMQPELMVTVPRVLNRIYAGIKHQMDTPGVKGSLLTRAVAAKIDKMHKTSDTTHLLWDKLIFNKIRQVLGGKIRLIITGSAPISPRVLDVLKVSLCIPIIEGYGLTETCICTRTIPSDPLSSGYVGNMNPGFEIKLVDVPEMNYFSTDRPYPRGEICIRSKSSMREYYKDSDKTKESFTDDGFFISGDIGQIDNHGRLKLIDRKKNIFKLAQGEYIAIEKLEGVFALCPTVMQLYIHADSLRSYLVAVVVPDPLELGSVVGCDANDRQALDTAIASEKVRGMIMAEIDKASNHAGLKGFERIKAVHITNDQFTIDNGLLTPTLKVKRNEVASKYKTTIDALYDANDKSAKL